MGGMDYGALDLLVLALATWRMASLLASEDGPFECFGKLRHLLGVRYDQSSQPYGTNWLAKGVTCVWCNSVWFGFFWVILYLFLAQYAVWLAAPLALSAVAILIQGAADR